MKYRIARDDVLIRIGHHFLPIQVDVWEAEKPKLTAICFHQYFGSTQEFHLLGRKFAEQGISVVAPLLPGRRPSAFLRDGMKYDLATFLRLLIQVCERYQTGRNCLIGHGFGGLLCLAAVRAHLVRPHAMVLQEVPIRGNWRDSRLGDTTAAICASQGVDADELGSQILSAVAATGQGPYSPEWAKSLLHTTDSGARIRLDPDLAGAEWPGFDFTGFLETTKIPTAVFCRKPGQLMTQIRQSGIPANPQCRLFEYSSHFLPGFGVTLSTLLDAFFPNIIDL